ncbi:MAG: Cys-tRNA(Pro) deacylase [Gemmatimonadota bacterium]
MTPAIRIAEAAGVPFQTHEYTVRPDAESYGLEAAAALGLPPEQVFKTLVTRLDGRTLALGLVPVHRTLDLKALAAALGGRRAEMAPVADAERATGYVTGGISPLGQRKALPTVVDVSVETLEWVCVSAGRRGLQLLLHPRDLIALTRGSTAAIAR